MVSANSTTGIWVGKDDVELFEAFDEYFESVDGDGYQRSSRVKDAMELYLEMHQAIANSDDLMDPEEYDRRELRFIVRDAFLQFD